MATLLTLLLALFLAMPALAEGFSIDRSSPGTASVSSAAVLSAGPVGGPPVEAIGPASLGLGPGTTDEIDALTLGAGSPGLRFHFSVSRSSMGSTGDVVAAAAAGQAAGDVYASDLDGTNRLAVNQASLGLLPAVGAGATVSPPIDDVDAFDFAFDGPGGLIVYALETGHPLTGSAPGCGGDLFFSGTLFLGYSSLGLGSCLDDVDAIEADTTTNTFFYSLAPGSPSLAPGSPIVGCAGGCSPADLFRIQAGEPSATRFATAADLGLLPGDDVDALSLAPPMPVPLPALPGAGGALLPAALVFAYFCSAYFCSAAWRVACRRSVASTNSSMNW